MKLPAFLLSFHTEKHVLRVKKSEISSENDFNGDVFEFEDNHESSKLEKSSFYVFFEICYPCFNPWTAK